jgi:glycosyltransferase involved in cell wall biosynthesis
VVTCEHPGAAEEEVEDGIHLYRVAPKGQANDFIHWVQLLNNAMFERGDRVVRELLGENADGSVKRPPADNPLLIHAHDWLAHFCAAGLKHRYQVPMVATIHATERGRNNGIYNDGQKYINSIEWSLQHEAWRLIVCTDFMRRECEAALQTPWHKMDVIYNGVDPSKFTLPDFGPAERAAFRLRFAAPEEKIIFFVGRMVREKGVQVLIEALPKVRWGYHDAKLLIVGGGHRDHLVNLASYLGMERHVYFTGFVPDEDLMKIYSVIDIASFPSLYEPFGIVALEAMAARVPVVVSDAGGLPEVVENGVTGVTTYAGNPNSLADGLLKLLHEPETAARMVETAWERLQTVFNWDVIATQTIGVYDRIWFEYLSSGWGGTAPAEKPAPKRAAAAKGDDKKPRAAKKADLRK